MYQNITKSIISILAVLCCSISMHATALSEELYDTMVFSPSKSFRIPIGITESERTSTKSIRLYRSDDLGTSWILEKETDSSVKHFSYHTEHDGEYWFSIALVDRQNRQHPADIRSQRPGIRVVVDTIAPKIKLTAVRDKTGKKGLKWEVDELNIDPESIQIAVRERESKVWKPLPIQEGLESIVQFPTDADYDKIQMFVKDYAANKSIQELTIFNNNRFIRTELDEFVLRRTSSSQFAQSDSKSEQTNSYAMNKTNSFETQTSDPQDPEDFDEIMNRIRELNRLREESKAEPQGAQVARQSTLPSQSENRLNNNVDNKMVANNQASNEHTNRKYEQIQQTNYSKSEFDQAANTNSDTWSDTRTNARPNQLNVNILNSRTIAVRYDPRLLNQSQLVELWGTSDQGATWSRLVADTDRISPIEATVPNDGEWGFRLVPVSTNSRSFSTVPPGTTPDYQVLVDTKAPTVAIEAEQYSDAKIRIQWVIIDDRNEQSSNNQNGANRAGASSITSIRLFTSDRLGGEWKPVVLNSTDSNSTLFTAKYRWSRFYFKLEVTDTAGNVASVVTGNPVKM